MRMAGMVTEAMHRAVTAAVTESHEQRFVSRMSSMRITATMMMTYVAMAHAMPVAITTVSMITVHKNILRCQGLSPDNRIELSLGLVSQHSKQLA